jgi:hypothetical protein
VLQNESLPIGAEVTRINRASCGFILYDFLRPVGKTRTIKQTVCLGFYIHIVGQHQYHFYNYLPTVWNSSN